MSFFECLPLELKLKECLVHGAVSQNLISICFFHQAATNGNYIVKKSPRNETTLSITKMFNLIFFPNSFIHLRFPNASCENILTNESSIQFRQYDFISSFQISYSAVRTPSQTLYIYTRIWGELSINLQLGFAQSQAKWNKSVITSRWFCFWSSFLGVSALFVHSESRRPAQLDGSVGTLSPLLFCALQFCSGNQASEMSPFAAIKVRSHSQDSAFVCNGRYTREMRGLPILCPMAVTVILGVVKWDEKIGSFQGKLTLSKREQAVSRLWSFVCKVVKPP